MKQLNIQKITIEAFQAKYEVNEPSYPVARLSEVMDLVKEDTVCFLVEDRLYVDPAVASSKRALTDQEAIARLEVLNETFRDAIIQLREVRYNGNTGAALEEKVKEIQRVMNDCINEAKGILNQCQIKDRNKLKKMSRKYFMAEFLNSLFDNEIYNVEVEIDCGQ